MMTPIKRAARASGYRLTDSECEQLKQQFAVSDVRSRNIPLGNPMWFQFWAHQCLDSVQTIDGVFNRYNGEADGQGMYPLRQDSLLLQMGRFRLSEFGLPVLGYTASSDDAPIEMTVDAHRANEQSVLTANEAMLICDMDFEELFDLKIPHFHQTLEWNFAAARWAHVQMPDTVNGRPIFDKVPSVTVDLRALFDGSEMARELNLGVSAAMTQMHHVRGEPSIFERTITRHNELGLPDFDDLARALRLIVGLDVSHCPIWPGIALEAQQQGNGLLGPVGRRAVADGIAGSLLWGRQNLKGLWHPRWPSAPVSTIDIIDYANGD